MASKAEPSPPGDGGRRPFLRQVFLWALGLGLLVAFLAWKNFDLSVLSGFTRWDYLVIATALIIPYPLILGLRTQVLLASLNLKIPLREAALASYAERFLSVVLPLRLNVPFKGFLLARLSKISVAHGVSVSIHEFALDIGVAFAISLVGIPVLWSRHPLLAWLLIAASSVCIAVVAVPPSAWNRLFPRHGRWVGAAIGLAENLHGSWNHLLRSPGLLLRLLLIVAVLQYPFVIYWFLFGAIGLSVDIVALLVALNAGALLGGLSLIPGGLGARELTMVGVLSQWGVPSTATVLVSLGGRLIYFTVEVIGFIFSLRVGGEAFRDLLRRLKQETGRVKRVGPETGPPRPPPSGE